MKKHKSILLLLLLCLMLGIGVWRNKSSFADLPLTTEANAASINSKKDMYQMIDEKAKKIKGSDEASIRDLADTIFNENGASDLPAAMVDMMKDSLVRAEMKYRNNGKGVRETHIAHTVNYLADKFGAPDYAKTTPLQVRLLRVKLMPMMPSLIAVDTDKEHKGLKKKIGSTITPEVSPLEATMITVMMIHQKMLNEEWQLSPEEFALKGKKQFFKGRGPMPPGYSSAGSTLSLKRNTEKAEEMQRLVRERVARMSLNEAAEIAEASLKNLGIEK